MKSGTLLTHSGPASGLLLLVIEQLLGRSAVIRPEAVLGYNRQNINDLPVTSPHGRDFADYAENLGFTFDAEAIRGTVMAHRDTR